jgi:hypothetical protein
MKKDMILVYFIPYITGFSFFCICFTTLELNPVPFNAVYVQLGAEGLKFYSNISGGTEKSYKFQ